MFSFLKASAFSPEIYYLAGVTSTHIPDLCVGQTKMVGPRTAVVTGIEICEYIYMLPTRTASTWFTELGELWECSKSRANGLNYIIVDLAGSWMIIAG